MTIKEILKLLVETEDLDERMALVEEHNDLFEVVPGEGNEDLVPLQEENESLRTELAAQKQKYRDRFFSGTEKEEEKEEPEDEEVEEKTLDEILKGGK